MGSSNEIFAQVRSAVDIVEIVGEHVALKRSGREFKGLCPFHDDHRPSMAVVPHKQIFVCFVCGMAGDVFKFVKEYHKMSSGEALRMLAQRAGIKLPELPRSGGRSDDGEGPTVKEQIASTNEWACSFFEKTLQSAEGKAGLDYFHSPGLSDETIEKFRLGMSPDSWTGIVNAALRLGTKPELLDQAGLIKKRSDSSPYDVFRNRVMFPIIDATGGKSSAGRVIAFGGRVLVEKRDETGNVVEAKYLNSPETRLFNKSESMYGMNLARQQITRTRTAVVVEGYMDVIACHQVGVTNVIATLGTALTPEHARSLKNYAQTIVLMFDSDDAGYRAADRAMEVFVRGTLDIKLSSVPDGKDPCDFCMKNGGEAFQKLVDNAVDAMTYQWNRLSRQFHATDSVTARQEVITQFLRFVAVAMESGGGAQAMDPVRRGLLLSKISGLVGMPLEDVTNTLKKLARMGVPAQNRNPKTEIRNENADPSTSWGPMEEGAAAEPVPEKIELRGLKGLDAAEGWLLGALLCQPPLFEKVREDLTLPLFVRLRSLAEVLLEYFENHADLSACTLADLTTVVENREIVRQAIELEKRVSDWRDSADISPASVKLLVQCADDRGVSLEMLVVDNLRELRGARSAHDPAADADLGISDEVAAAPSAEDELRAFMTKVQEKNQQGGNRRITGPGSQP